jgi:hypothetical protein
MWVKLKVNWGKGYGNTTRSPSQRVPTWLNMAIILIRRMSPSYPQKIGGFKEEWLRPPSSRPLNLPSTETSEGTPYQPYTTEVT